MSFFPKDLILENERVLLRPLIHDDLQFLLPFAITEPETWDYSLIKPIGQDGMKAYTDHMINERDAQNEYPFIVFDKAANSYAGSTRFYDIQLNNLTVQLGYTWYGKQFRRTGLNRHCKFLLLSYAFELWGMERVEFRADARNDRSIEAMKNIGCIVEGILRSNSIIDTGGRRDSIVLSILKHEWFDHVKENLEKKIQV